MAKVKVVAWVAVGIVAFAVLVVPRFPRTHLAHWTLPDGYEVSADTTELTILVTVDGCHDGGGAERFITEPRVTYSPEAVSIEVGIKDYYMDGCAGYFGGTPVDVQLDEPVGDRALTGSAG